MTRFRIALIAFTALMLPAAAMAQATTADGKAIVGEVHGVHNDVVSQGNALGAKLDMLHSDMQALLKAMQAAPTATATAATSSPTSTTTAAPASAPAVDALAAKFFPADPGLAAFPSPENSRALRNPDGSLGGRGYLLDANGTVHRLIPPTADVPNGYTVNGSWAKGGGSDHSPVPQLIVRQGKVFAQAAGGPWQFYNSAGGSLYNASLPDAFQTDASGATTSTIAASSVTAPAPAARQSPAPGTSGKTLTVGAGKAFPTITAAITAGAAGDTIDIAPGIYKETPPAWTVPLKIVFEQGAKLDTTGLTTLARGKGALVPAADSVIVNPVITGAGMMETTAGGTAAIRPDMGCGYLDIQGGTLSGNQNGIAGGDVPVVLTVTGTDISGNGLGDGYTHDIYMSHGTLSVTLTNVTSLNPNGGHAAKLRAFAVSIVGGSYEAFSAAAIDIPDGTVGQATIDGATITKKAGAYNHTVLDYATEDTASGNGGLLIKNTTMNLLCDNPSIMVGGGSSVTIDPSTKLTGTKPTAQGGTVKGL